MENYYEILGLDQNGLVGDLDSVLKKMQRKWQSRTNAPDLTKRQEAEKMLKLVTEAKGILNDEKKKAAYDKRLKKQKPKQQERVTSSIYDQSELLIESKKFIADNKIADALLLLKRLILEDPNHSEGHSNYAYCLSRMNRLMESIQSYETALALDPENGNIFYDLIYVYIEKEDFNVAEQYLNRALRIVSDTSPFLRLQTYIMNIKGNYDQTIALVENKLTSGETVPDQVLADLCDAYENKALVYYSKGQNGYFYLTEDNHIDEVLGYWDKIKKYKHVYDDKNYPDTQYNSVKDLKKKTFFKEAWKVYVIPVLGLVGLFLMAQETPEMMGEILATMAVLILFIAFTTYLAVIPHYKINKSYVTGKKLPVQWLIKLNGLIVTILTILFVVMFWIARVASESNNR